MITQDGDRHLGFLLHDVARLLRRNFNRRVETLGLTQTQWRALVQLSHREGINQAALSEILEIQPITLTRLIDRMEAAGWVERRPHPTDRRAVCLYLTDKAQPVLSEIHLLSEETRREALLGMSDERVESLISTLQAIKQNLIATECPSDAQAEDDVTADKTDAVTAREDERTQS